MFWQFLIDIDVFINTGQCQDPADPLVDPHSQHRTSGKPDIFIPAHDHSDTGAVHKTGLFEIKNDTPDIPCFQQMICLFFDLLRMMMIQFFRHMDRQIGSSDHKSFSISFCLLPF